MRIAMLTNNYKPFIGGVPISVDRLANALRERGNEVYVFAPTYENQEEEEYVIRFSTFAGTIAGAVLPNPFDPRIEQKMKALKIDVIHVHHPALMGNVALHLRKKLGIPVVFTYHTMYEEYLHYLKMNRITKTRMVQSTLNHYLESFSNQCDMLVAPTPLIAKYLKNKNISTDVRVIPTGLLEDSFMKEDAKVQEIREKYLGERDYLLISVQRLAEEKNIDFQLKGLATLKKQLGKTGKTFYTLFIGDGPERKHLTEYAEKLGLNDCVEFIGNVANQEIKNYQNAGDLFLFSSKSETQGIVLLEAMAAGNPVIAVSANGVDDVVINGYNGYRTAENVETWAQKAQEVLDDSQLYQSLSMGARRTAESYKEIYVAKDCELLYAQAIQNFYAKELMVQAQESVVY